MKRDDDYIRRMLLALELADDPYLAASQETNSMSASEVKKNYHIALLCDAGFMKRHSETRFRMTNQGHDYVLSIEDDGVWDQTKKSAAQVGGVALGLMKDIALGYVKQKLVGLGIPVE
ncbi:hypothetical protein TM1040_1308 [Ruegeria sp. TM1040]|uniref:DUF2513 domain-containing protein n=1 Tax=Ruegeria sp. (strain TM1040) TaxID=292414 RepID=UPI00005554D3|nr:DUF2513 domain-containing protein [Ruegeria sp. TM1040]ABF64041.1 hypothetical protein TM1040_1308 [Ruegeria sp. TM1040]